MKWLALLSDRYLPKAELNTRNSTKRRRKASFGWVSGVQLDSQEKKNYPLSAENRLCTDGHVIGYWSVNCMYRRSSWTAKIVLFQIFGRWCNKYPPCYTVLHARRVTIFLVTWVEHQKLNQTTPYGVVWLSFWYSTHSGLAWASWPCAFWLLVRLPI